MPVLKPVQKWEYYVANVSEQIISLERYLAEKGLDGWEIVSHLGGSYPWEHRFIFKRPLR